MLFLWLLLLRMIVQKNAHLPRRPLWIDWRSGLRRWPNHPWQFFGNCLRGFECVRGRILPFSYLQAVAVTPQCWRYCTACDYHRQHHRYCCYYKTRCTCMLGSVGVLYQRRPLELLLTASTGLWLLHLLQVAMVQCLTALCEVPGIESDHAQWCVWHETNAVCRLEYGLCNVTEVLRWTRPSTPCIMVKCISAFTRSVELR